MKKLLVNLALLSLGALAFAAATLIPPMTAHATAAATMASPGIDWGFWLGAIATALAAASLFLHWLAPRTKATWDDKLRDDIDEVLAFARSVKTDAQPPPRPPQAGKIIGPVLLALSFLGLLALAVAATGCGGSQTSRATTIGSFDKGLTMARAGLRAWEHERTEAIVAQGKAHAITADQAQAQVTALWARVDKVELALDAAVAAEDAANTLNDDTSIKGAVVALDNAIAAYTALTGGTP